MPRTNARDRILDRAVQVASVHGLDGLTIGQLAKAVKMSKGGICAHFATKAELQVAAVERAAYIFRQAVVVPAMTAPAGLRRLEALVERWFDYTEAGVFEGGCFFTNAALELHKIETVPARDSVREQYRAFLGLVQGCIEQAVAAGELAAGTDVERLSLELHGIEVASLVRYALEGDTAVFAAGRETARELLARHGS